MRTLRRVLAGLVLACLLVVASYAVATAHREPAQRPVRIVIDSDVVFTPTAVRGPYLVFNPTEAHAQVLSAPEVWATWSHGHPIPERETVHFGRLTSQTEDVPTDPVWGFSGGVCPAGSGPPGAPPPPRDCVNWWFFDALTGEMVLGTGQVLAQSR